MVIKKQQRFAPLVGWQNLGQRVSTAAKIFACIVVMCLAACGNNDELNDGRGDNLGDSKGNGIKVSLKENFRGNPKRNIYNIQVYETIFYDLEVTVDGDAKTYNYWLNLRSNPGPHHQRLGKDYKAWLFTDANYKLYLKLLRNPSSNEDYKKRDKLLTEALLTESDFAIQPNAKYILLVEPLVIGTFQLSPKFYRKKKDDTRTDTAEPTINFNCTSIEAWWVDTEDRSGGLFQESRSHNAFYFQVNDGTAETDRYLAKKENRKRTFEIIYNGQTYTGDFVEGKPIWFHNSEQRRGAPPVDNRIISYVKLSITEPGQEQINIEYYDIYMNKRN